MASIVKNVKLEKKTEKTNKQTIELTCKLWLWMNTSVWGVEEQKLQFTIWPVPSLSLQIYQQLWIIKEVTMVLPHV